MGQEFTPNSPDLSKRPETLLDPSKYIFVAGNGNIPLATKVATRLGLEPHFPASKFNDGETRVQYDTSPNITGRTAIIFQTHPTGSQNEAIMEQLLITYGVAKSGPDKVVGVMPYIAYGREDLKRGSGQPVSAALVLEMLGHVGYNRLLTFDMHNPAIASAFKGTMDILPGWHVLKPAIEDYMGGPPDLLMSPDAGRFKQVERDAATFGRRPAIGQMLKIRNGSGIQHHGYVSEISLDGVRMFVGDDLISTGETIRKAAKVAKQEGAEEVLVVATHGVFTGEYEDNLLDPDIDHIIVTDTIDTGKLSAELKAKTTTVSVADMLAQAIHANETGISLQDLFYKITKPSS